MAHAAIKSTTQEFLDIFDITNDTLVMKNGGVSLILTVNAMNFSLLAEQEQDAVIYTYAALLNSLNYPIQIVIQSQTKDATVYLNLLKKQEKKASDNNKKQLIARYRNFVSELIKQRNVLDKKFYLVIPATALEMGFFQPKSMILGSQKFDIASIERTTLLEKAQSILEPRKDHLIAQFGRIGLYARQLNTQEIIQIFYNNYNPEASEGQQITNSNNYTTPLVRATTIGGDMDNPTPTPPTNTPPADQPADPTAETPAVSPEPAAPTTPENKPEDTTPPVEPATPPSTSTTQISEPISPIQKPTTSSPSPATTSATTTPSTTSSTPTASTGKETPPSAPAGDNAQQVIDSSLQQIKSTPPATTPTATNEPTTPPVEKEVTPPVEGKAGEKSGSKPSAMTPLPEI